MTLRKASAVLSLLGLVVSLSILLLTNAQAAAKSSRALSPAEMAATRGAGLGICDSHECTGTNGCTSDHTAWQDFYPKYRCVWRPYGSCDNFANGSCWKKWYYASQMCSDSNYLTGGTYTEPITYCGTG